MESLRHKFKADVSIYSAYVKRGVEFDFLDASGVAGNLKLRTQGTEHSKLLRAARRAC